MRSIASSLSALCLLVASPAFAAAPASQGASARPAAAKAATPAASADLELQRARAAFEKRFPTVKPTGFRAAPVAGFYEVTLGIDVYYVTADARYLVRGTLVGLDDNSDLKEQRQAEIRRAMLEAVPASQFIVFGPSAPKYTVTVFTDVDCAYCRRLHSQIDEYAKRGIQVRYLFFPRTGLGSESWQKAQDVWCAADRNAALTAAKRGEALPHAACDTTAVTTGYRLGETFRLDGTPLIISADGYQIGGYLTPDEMQGRLDALASKRKRG